MPDGQGWLQLCATAADPAGNRIHRLTSLGGEIKEKRTFWNSLKAQELPRFLSTGTHLISVDQNGNPADNQSHSGKILQQHFEQVFSTVQSGTWLPILAHPRARFCLGD
jgi:hypothetical protein